MSLPSLSLVMDFPDLFGTNGIYTNPEQHGVAWERPVSVEWIDPQGHASFQENAGLRIQGGGFRSFSATQKKSFRLLFKSEYGAPQLRFPCFGPDAADHFDNLVLRASGNDEWAADGGPDALYIRDAFAMATAHDMGLVASHGTFVHLYLNGFYWGLYNPVERPDAAFSAAYYGGRKEDWDSFNSGSVPTDAAHAWNRLLAIARNGLSNNENYQFIQGKNPDGTPNPQFENLLDIDNLIDYMILNCYIGKKDWPERNYWVARDRNDGNGFKFYPWDSEFSIGLQSTLQTDQTRVSTAVAEPYARARDNPDFRRNFGDHLYRHFFHGGALTVDASHPSWNPAHPESNRPAARFMELAELVDRAMVGESARWGDQSGSVRAPTIPFTRDEHWRPARDKLLTNYFPQRSTIVLDDFRMAGLYPFIDPPEFNQRGGSVPIGFSLVMTAAKGTIYYTTNGLDPSTLMTIEEISRRTLVARQAFKRALVPSPANGGTNLGSSWQGGHEPFADEAWTNAAGGVGYDVGAYVLFSPFLQLNLRADMYRKNGSAFIRIPFDWDGVDAERLNFMTLRVRYDDGFAAFLNGLPVASVNAPSSLAWNSNATQKNSYSKAVTFEDFYIDAFLPALKRGQNILAIQGLNVASNDSNFLIDCELNVGEFKKTRAPAVQTYAGPWVLDDLTLVKARAVNGLEWSALQEAAFIVGSPSLVITEVHYHPLAPSPAEQTAGFTQADDFEFIELLNKGNRTCDLRGLRFITGIQFDFTASAITRLSPGSYVLVVKNRAAFEFRYGLGFPVAGQFSGQLSNSGESLVLANAGNETVAAVTYATRAPWPESPDGGGPSLELIDPWGDPNSPANWRASPAVGGTPGGAEARVQLSIQRDENHHIRLSWNSVSNRPYFPQWSSDLSPRQWHSLGNAITGNGSMNLFTDTNNPPRRFYRIAW